MFEEFVSELRNLEMSQDIRFPINIPLDDNGYFDRACPHSECRENFKVLFDDWRDKVPEAADFVPNAAQKTTRSNSTQNPRTNLFKKLPMHMQWRNLMEAMGRAARRTKTKKISTGFFDIKMDVSYHAGPTPVVLPSSASEVMRQDFLCESCGCRYSTIGAGYFCPACCHNSAAKDFDQTIDTILKVVDSLDEIGQPLAEKVQHRCRN